jgi:hypothetical protein
VKALRFRDVSQTSSSYGEVMELDHRMKETGGMRMDRTRRSCVVKSNRIAIVVVCALAAAALGTATSPAGAAPRWAPASEATIHPGVQTVVSGIQCRASFVLYDAHAVYLGQSARCWEGRDWRSPASPPALGTPIEIEGASRPGTIVYNSLLTMARVHESNEATLQGNDFALVRVHNDDRGRVNPSVPFWGGPIASSGRSSFGARVYTYGNSEVYIGRLRTGTIADLPGQLLGDRSAEVNQLSPRAGIDMTAFVVPFWESFFRGKDTEGWTRYIYTAAPGISGDTGSAVLDERGRALGILGSAAHDAADRVTDLSKALRYMKANTSLDAIQLATGTTRFSPQL